MNKAILCLGIDLFDKNDIWPLSGAAQDARRWAGFFEHRLGFTARVLTHEDIRAGARVMDVVDELLAIAGGEGDVLGVFLATHGKQVPHPQGGYDQAFLLPHARLASLEAGTLGEGALSLRQLAAETARQGLQRFFIIDACRAPLKQPPGGPPRDACPHFEAEGQLVYRDPGLRVGPDPRTNSPLLVVNACADRQRAGELRRSRRGLFSMAAEDVASQRLAQGIPWVLNTEFLATVGARMRQLAHEHQEDALLQDPVIDQGEALCLWQPPQPPLALRAESAAQAAARSQHAGSPPPPAQVAPTAAERLGQLLGRFEQQLAAGRLSSPPWDCCLGTLALLHDAGLGEHTLALLQRQVESAAAAPAGTARPPGADPAWGTSPPAPAISMPSARQPKAWSSQPAGSAFRDADWAPQMVVIPAGRFVMGSPNDEKERFATEGPQREVAIRQAFGLGRCVVTFDDYDRYAQEAGVALPSDGGWGRGNRPVIHVSWHDAQAYIAWLNGKLGLGDAKAYRLPTEAEWEYAVRAGTKTAFWWGDRITTRQANYDGNHAYAGGGQGEYRKKTVEADAFDPNPWGLYNVHGNVWEWLQDWWHDDYRGAPETERAWEEGSDKSRRVVRGGSWNYLPGYLRSAFRKRNEPVYRSDFLGFRLARTF